MLEQTTVDGFAAANGWHKNRILRPIRECYEAHRPLGMRLIPCPPLDVSGSPIPGWQHQFLWVTHQHMGQAWIGILLPEAVYATWLEVLHKQRPVYRALGVLTWLAGDVAVIMFIARDSAAVAASLLGFAVLGALAIRFRRRLYSPLRLLPRVQVHQSWIGPVQEYQRDQFVEFLRENGGRIAGLATLVILLAAGAGREWSEGGGKVVESVLHLLGHL